jgi:RNA polymerase sigma-70 factor (ECF subfamily)
MTDDSLVASFTEFYRRHSADVFRFALFLCRNRADADDITSETFVRAWVGADRIRADTVKQYLFTIARNLHIQTAAKRGRETDLGDWVSDTSPDPHLQAERRSDIAAVRERLLLMPETDRAAFLMRVVDGLPYEEISRALSISLSSAKVKVHRARLSLAELR